MYFFAITTFAFFAMRIHALTLRFADWRKSQRDFKFCYIEFRRVAPTCLNQDIIENQPPPSYQGWRFFVIYNFIDPRESVTHKDIGRIVSDIRSRSPSTDIFLADRFSHKPMRKSSREPLHRTWVGTRITIDRRVKAIIESLLTCFSSVWFRGTSTRQATYTRSGQLCNGRR